MIGYSLTTADQRKSRKCRVHAHKKRARRRGVPIKLSPTDWLRCLLAFGYSCAYCGRRQNHIQQDLTLDCFVPLGVDYTPGLIVTNVVPACDACNQAKHDLDPETWLNRQFGGLEAQRILWRIGDYFASLEAV